MKCQIRAIPAFPMAMTTRRFVMPAAACARKSAAQGVVAGVHEVAPAGGMEMLRAGSTANGSAVGTPGAVFGNLRP